METLLAPSRSALTALQPRPASTSPGRTRTSPACTSKCPATPSTAQHTSTARRSRSTYAHLASGLISSRRRAASTGYTRSTIYASRVFRSAVVITTPFSMLL
ncbi:hypothetical protein BGZ61DRAFT_463010 [Ilyonectria robusta]|uniref:uncharacterized protein n=1 Tax=Ilyonectria robusta TaxID=1079257 RepID=UPI001E8CC67F|nr:uncharacterized protein BGZ61DRAFT_463010 [Ilyonectria robusta]KAH8662685.1 hypothetical protein BGZ61DRAFT_463010 [Ilyonectria robusta]